MTGTAASVAALRPRSPAHRGTASSTTGAPPGLVLALLEEIKRDPTTFQAFAALVAEASGPRPPERWIGATEKSAQLGCSREVLMRWSRNGRVPGARKVAGKWRYPAGELTVLEAAPRPTDDRLAARGRRCGTAASSPGAMAMRALRNVGA